MPNVTPNQDKSITEVLDNQRFAEISASAHLAINLWNAIGLAAERGEAATVSVHWRQIVTLTRAVRATVSELGSAEAVHARDNDNARHNPPS